MLCWMRAPRISCAFRNFLHLFCPSLLLSSWCRELSWGANVTAHQSLRRSRWNSAISSKECKVSSAKRPNLWRGQRVGKPTYCMHLQEPVCIFWRLHVSLTGISQKCVPVCLCNVGRVPVCVHVMVFLELTAIGCSSDFCVPFSKCNPSVVAFWLC